MRVLENRVLREIFGPRRDDVTGEWRKLHNEELNDPYCLPYIGVMNEVGWECGMYGGEERCVEGVGGEA